MSFNIISSDDLTSLKIIFNYPVPMVNAFLLLFRAPAYWCYSLTATTMVKRDGSDG